jgi:hypothetical protein
MTRRLALLVLGVVCLMPVGAFAGPPCDSVPGPGPVVSATHYSPWHYRTPLLYRCWLEHHYGVTAGKCGPGCYAPVPSSAPTSQNSGSAPEPGKLSDGASLAAPAASPDANGPQQRR